MLFLYASLLIIGILFLIRSGTWVVNSLTKVAQMLGASEYTVAFILMAAATSLPELAVGVSAALSGDPLLSLGNVIGSNIVNLTLILGFIAVAANGIKINEKTAGQDAWLIFVLTSAPLILMTDLKLSRGEGVLLLLLFAIYMGKLLRVREIIGERGKLLHLYENGILEWRVFTRQFSLLILSIAALLVAALIVTESASRFSFEVGVPEFIISLFILAIGTSLPELVFSLKTAFAKRGDLSIGNLLGSSVFNSTFILGITALISPIQIQEKTAFLVSAFAMIAAVFFTIFFIRTFGKISRREGFILVLFYLLFALAEWVF